MEPVAIMVIKNYQKVILACQPKDIKILKPSKYSLDDKDKLPPLLVYKL